MLHPIRTVPYKFQSVPLTKVEKKKAEKLGHDTSHIKGVFRYQGTTSKQKKMILVFREDAKLEDGVIVGGRTVAMTTEDFDLGLDLGKIKGRARKAKAS